MIEPALEVPADASLSQVLDHNIALFTKHAAEHAVRACSWDSGASVLTEARHAFLSFTEGAKVLRKVRDLLVQREPAGQWGLPGENASITSNKPFSGQGRD